LYSVATPPPPTPLDVLAEASTDPTEDAADDALSPDEEEQNKPTTKRERAPAKSKSVKSVKRAESVKKVTRKGVYMEGRPSLDLVTPSDCKAPSPLLFLKKQHHQRFITSNEISL
jgi:hypothetical protein